MVAFHTYGWTQNCVSSLQTHVPEWPILVVDNNPHKDDPPDRLMSYQGTTRGGLSASWDRYTEAETDWLRDNDVFVVQTPRNSSHGGSIDVAIDWCLRHSYRFLIHVEPDCLVFGRQWCDNLVFAIRNRWMAGSLKVPSGELHITPTLWDVWAIKRLGASFECQPRSLDRSNPKYTSLINDDRRPWTDGDLWDTGMRAWYMCAINAKACRVVCPDLVHYWCGTVKRAKQILLA